MAAPIQIRDRGEVTPSDSTAPAGSVRRLGSVIGLVTIATLDLLALDDITTAGAWMPEIGFVIASVPALIALGYYAFRPTPSATPPDDRTLEGRLAPRREPPGGAGGDGR